MKVVIIFLIFTINLFAFSKKELQKIYEVNFNKSDLFKVKKIDNRYFILSSKIIFNVNTTRINNERLELLSKAMLLQFFREKDKNIKAIDIKKFQSIFSWQKDDRIYLLSFVSKKNVKCLYKKNKVSKDDNIIEQEIYRLEKIKNKPISVHTQLKALYFNKSDMINYNKEVEKVMDMKFNDF